MTVIKITVIHSKGYNQITMGIETLRNIVIITTDIFAVHTKEFVKITRLYGPKCAMQLAIQPSKQVSIQTAAGK